MSYKMLESELVQPSYEIGQNSQTNHYRIGKSQERRWSYQPSELEEVLNMFEFGNSDY